MAFTALLATGCRTSKQYQLEAVAKDWSKVIRASQIIPVYPLTEDLQPGDVFLVQVPIDRQQVVYKKKGYLPLDNHITRLHPEGFGSFYDHSFLNTGTNSVLPGHWIRPAVTNLPSWQPAPHAAFPTYSFSVRSGAGLNLAVPVQGVPVGLSLLGTDSANGMIAIRKASTLGVDTRSLYTQVQQWAAANADFLKPFAAEDDSKRNYLRVVTRVYATGEMDVSMADASARAAGVDVGAAKPVQLLFADLPASGTNTTAVTLSNFTNNVGILNKLLESMQAAATSAGGAAGGGQMLPGGSLRLNAASSRFVSLRETFPFPLIIGYLGFDCAILEGGAVGPPIPTHSRLETMYKLADRFGDDEIGRIYADALQKDIYEMLRARKGDPQARALVAMMDALEGVIPADWKLYQYDPDQKLLASLPSQAGSPGATPGYLRYRSFQGERRTSIGALSDALKAGSFEWQQPGGEVVRVKRGSEEWQRLQQIQEDLLKHQENPLEKQAVRNAHADATSYFLKILAE